MLNPIRKAYGGSVSGENRFRFRETQRDIGFQPSTTENLAVYLWNKIKPKLNELSEIYLQETATAGVIYNGS